MNQTSPSHHPQEDNNAMLPVMPPPRWTFLFTIGLLGCSPEQKLVAAGDTLAVATTEPQRTNPWWCLCYQRNLDQNDVTACRETPSDCEELRVLVEKGTSEILAGSAKTGCEAVHSQHPGDSLGTRAQWRPSKKAGSWVSNGSCLLPGRTGG